MRVCQLVEIDPAESVLHFTKFEIASLWAKNKHWQRVCNNIL